MPNKLTIAIDGPAGAGKSTVARMVAVRLGLTYLDTGAMYRSVALHCLRKGVDPCDGTAAEEVAQTLRFRFAPSPDGSQRIEVNEEDVTEAVRSPEVAAASSRVAVHAGVRRAMVAVQQRLAAQGGVVMEGRDIGTVVLPSADLKVFLTASAETRAVRRCLELSARGTPQPLSEVLAQIEERDRRDREREDSPLRPAQDAVIVNTDGLSVEDVVERIVALARERERSE